MPRNYKTDLFQHRHYEWLAEFLGTARAKSERNEPGNFETRLIAALKPTNPKFNSERVKQAVEAARLRYLDSAERAEFIADCATTEG